MDIDTLLRKAGITAVYVTHDQAEAMALGDRIVVMDHGEIVQIGTPTQIYHAPANSFVADFVGSVNRLQGKVQGGLWRCGDAALPWPASAPAGGVVMVRPEDLRLAGMRPPGPSAGASPRAISSATARASWSISARARRWWSTPASAANSRWLRRCICASTRPP